MNAVTTNESQVLELASIEQPAPSPVAIRPADQNSAMAMMMAAVDRGIGLDQVEKMMRIQREWQADEARKAYHDAMAVFKENPPRIIKRKEVDFETQRGRTNYRHATHSDVTSPIIAALAKVGISHKWVPSQSGSIIRIECVLTHRLGHSESVYLEAGADQSGGKNSIQAIISAKTYLERHTLLAATGLTTEDIEDDDGASFGKDRGTNEPGATDELQAFRDAAMRGTAALREHYESHRPKDEFWTLHKKELRAAAKAVDEGGAR